jgi:bifunctional non-homologous end joining protein LigD
MPNQNTNMLLNTEDETQVKEVNGHPLTFNHLNKLYWPDDGFTKRDMINYYDQVAPYMLPYLLDRPVSLNRFPNGINDHSFFQKDITGISPEWVDFFEHTTAEGELVWGASKSTPGLAGCFHRTTLIIA